MLIYKITNILNGKCYVGQTISKLEQRWYKHCHKSSGCLALHNAIKLYGKENFTIEQIDTATNQDELNVKEKYWIEYFNCISPNGYNLKSGGKDCEYTNESIAKMKASLKKVWENKVSPSAIPIYQFDLSGQFIKQWSSATKAAETLKLSQPDIHRCCSNTPHYKSVGGYIWSYSQEPPMKYERLGNGLKAKVLCIETGETYNSIAEAELITKIKRQNISKCCRGVQKTAGGYHWRYYDNEEVG